MSQIPFTISSNEESEDMFYNNMFRDMFRNMSYNNMSYQTYYLSDYETPIPFEEILFNTDINSDQELKRDEKNVITFETKKYKTLTTSLDNCVICSDKFNDDDDVSILECVHIFHPNCIKEWCYYKPECPLCKIPIAIAV